MTGWSVLGTISGTSADGIDLAEIETDGTTVHRFGPAGGAPYRAATRRAVLAAIAKGPIDRDIWPEIAVSVTDDHAEAIERFLDNHQRRPDLVVFHGQTVWHDPDAGETVQLGKPQQLADRLGLPVIGDVRLADMAAGGEGAPLVPVYHRALARSLVGEAREPLCFLNIGGVSNLTYVDGQVLTAFDIGPGNALLDDWVRRHGAGDFDQNGHFALSGAADLDRVDEALGHPYFHRSGPKSLDRNAFSLDFVDGMTLQDGAATLAAFTAATIAGAVGLLPRVPSLWVVCGGGRRNPAIMNELDERLVGEVVASDIFGIDGDALEAQAMAFVGARFMDGLPTTYPETTGAERPVVGGRLYRPTRSRPVAG